MMADYRGTPEYANGYADGFAGRGALLETCGSYMAGHQAARDLVRALTDAGAATTDDGYEFNFSLRGETAQSEWK